MTASVPSPWLPTLRRFTMSIEAWSRRSKRRRRLALAHGRRVVQVFRQLRLERRGLRRRPRRDVDGLRAFARDVVFRDAAVLALADEEALALREVQCLDLRRDERRDIHHAAVGGR